MNRTDFEVHCAEQIGEAFSSGIQRLGEGRVQRWVLRPGMEFQSPLIWWGDVSKTREAAYGGGPHEGIDFALGVDAVSGRVEADMEGLRVPLFTRGMVTWCFHDLVGDTVIVATEAQREDMRLIIQYSHIVFEEALLGQQLESGTCIGTIKRSDNPKSATASHLHISTALLKAGRLKRAPQEVDFETWLEFERLGELVYLDPLALVSDSVKKRFFLMGEESRSPLHSILCSGAKKADRLTIRRVLARDFPGLQVLTQPSPEAGRKILHARGLLVQSTGEDWVIEMGDALKIRASIPLTGHDSASLLEAIRDLESINGNGLTPK